MDVLSNQHRSFTRLVMVDARVVDLSGTDQTLLVL